MTFVEVLIGCAIALAIILGAVFFALRTPKLKGPNRHDIRGSGHDGMGGDGGGD